MNRTALITGASSGFGLLTSVTLARRGWRVLATVRDLTRRGKLVNAARDADTRKDFAYCYKVGFISVLESRFCSSVKSDRLTAINIKKPT